MAAAASSTGGSGSAAAPNYLAAAAGNIDQNRANLLAQIGQQGSAALAAYQAAQGATAAGKTAAVKAALADAINRGASTGGTVGAPGEAGALTAPVAMPYDRASAMLGADQAARQSQFAGQAAGAGAYMDEAKAAIPALQAAVQQRVIAAQQALAKQAMADQQAQQIRDLQLQQLLAKSQAPQTIGQIIAANGGAGLLGDQLYNTGAAQGAALSANPSPADFASANQTGRPTDNSTLGIAGLLGGTLGIGSGNAQSLAAQSPQAKADAAAQKTAQDQQAKLNTQNYIDKQVNDAMNLYEFLLGQKNPATQKNGAPGRNYTAHEAYMALYGPEAWQADPLHPGQKVPFGPGVVAQVAARIGKVP